MQFILEFMLSGGIRLDMRDFMRDFIEFMKIGVGVEFDEMSETEFQIEGTHVINEETRVVTTKCEGECQKFEHLFV